MDIIFNPPQNEENKYVDIMVSSLPGHGFQIHPLDTVFSNRRHFRAIKLVHLNWFENLDESSAWKAFRSFLRKFTVLAILKISGKTLVWTMHNRDSHEKRLGYFSRLLTRLLVSWTHAIVIHTTQSRILLLSKNPNIANKLTYIPHPNFIGMYGSCDERASGNTALSLLFIGAVKPYKNIELLIDTVAKFGDEAIVTIAGKPSSIAYHSAIEKKAATTGNVRLLLRFINDTELAGLIAHADILVLPYDLNSSLNSGTALLAFSYKKTVICPDIGTTQDMGPMRSDILHYTYTSEEEHRHALYQKIAEAIRIKQENPDTLSQQGERLYAYVRQAHDQTNSSEKLVELYQDLLNR